AEEITGIAGKGIKSEPQQNQNLYKHLKTHKTKTRRHIPGADLSQQQARGAGESGCMGPGVSWRFSVFGFWFSVLGFWFSVAGPIEQNLPASSLLTNNYSTPNS